MFNKINQHITTSDIYTLFMLFFYTLLAIIFCNKIKDCNGILFLNFFLINSILLVTYLQDSLGNNKTYIYFRSLYMIPIVFIIYSQVQIYIPFLNNNLFDNVLAEWDRVLFGTNPTEFLYQFSNPILTEYFQFSYMSYYISPVILGIELLNRETKKYYNFMLRSILFSFYLSYLFYFFMPAIGPRFIIHDFFNLSNELPGLLLTDFFRNIVNIGGGIPTNAVNPQDFVNRDCMPSGHTWISIILIFTAFKTNSKFRYLILVLGISLIIATVYLRYHYVVDVIAGIILAFISIKFEPILNNLINKKINLLKKSN